MAGAWDDPSNLFGSNADQIIKGQWGEHAFLNELTGRSTCTKKGAHVLRPVFFSQFVILRDFCARKSENATA